MQEVFSSIIYHDWSLHFHDRSTCKRFAKGIGRKRKLAHTRLLYVLQDTKSCIRLIFYLQSHNGDECRIQIRIRQIVETRPPTQSITIMVICIGSQRKSQLIIKRRTRQLIMRKFEPYIYTIACRRHLGPVVAYRNKAIIAVALCLQTLIYPLIDFRYRSGVAREPHH